MEEQRFAFLAEWYDAQAALVRRFHFLFFPRDNSVEMYDLKNRRIFLKRSKNEAVRLDQCYIGGVINLLGRQLKITDFADNYTRTTMAGKKEKTLALIKPDAFSKMGCILEIIYQEGFQISEAKSVVLSPEDVEEFYAEHRGKSFFNRLTALMTSGPTLALELLAANAVIAWRKLIGPTDSATARSEAPGSLRGQFGTDSTRNACHGSDSSAAAERERAFFFGSRRSRSSAVLRDSTCCLIKPHSVLSGNLGRIVRAVQESPEGYTVTALQLFHLDKANAEEFLEVYKGVLAEYNQMVTQLCSGPCVVLEVFKEGGNIVKSFREVAGPMDPEIARHLRPHTLRAKFGRDKIENCIHCTDLVDDGPLEVEYFFKILQK